MATSGTLIDDVVRFTDLPSATIKAYVQTLRENRLIRKTGRGPSAAAMTNLDAAALLAATLANPTIAEAANATSAALFLPSQRITLNAADLFDKEAVAYMSSFLDKESRDQVTTFGGMLRWLLFNAENACLKNGAELTGWERLFAPKWKPVGITYCRPPDMAVVEFRFHPHAAAFFEYRHANPSELGSVEKSRVEGDDPLEYPPLFRAYQYSGERTISARFAGGSTIVAFARSVLKPIPPRP